MNENKLFLTFIDDTINTRYKFQCDYVRKSSNDDETNDKDSENDRNFPTPTHEFLSTRCSCAHIFLVIIISTIEKTRITRFPRPTTNQHVRVCHGRVRKASKSRQTRSFLYVFLWGYTMESGGENENEKRNYSPNDILKMVGSSHVFVKVFSFSNTTFPLFH